MTVKNTISAACVAVALTVMAAGCFGSDDAGNPASQLSAGEAAAPLEHASPELKKVRKQANRLLPGGADAFGERLDSLRGTPVVVNNWASWCGPCRVEFPYFQALAIRMGDEIAFLGVDTDDNEDAANTFLGELPLPYPSYADPDSDIKKDFFDSPVGLPNTAFYDSSGERVYVHQGPYASEDELEAEIHRYAQ